jgi:FtsP/CotA-like multicopper oxidase with cupredoxin domain
MLLAKMLLAFATARIVAAQNLPSLPNNLCSLDKVYDSIKTNNVVEVTLQVRYKDCPSNKGNKPCSASNTQGYSPGPKLNGVETTNSILVNNEIPGPEIRAKLGDTVRVTVLNYLGEPSTMHFHGITQFRTPFMDGDEMVSNCPIPPGKTYTYEFIAHPAGTTFYHSHSGSQRIAGMTGPLIIEDDKEPFAELPDKVIFLQDWYAQNADNNFNFWGQNLPGNCVTFGGNQFTGDLNPNVHQIGAVVGDGMLFQSFIINGLGIYDYKATQIKGTMNDLIHGDMTFADMKCPGQSMNAPQCEYCFDPETWTSELCDESSGEGLCGQPAVIEVEVGVQTRLRFAHAGGLFAAQVCIDGNSVDIIAADGSPVQPYTTNCFIIFTAERYDVIVKPNTPGDYLIRFSTTEERTANSNNTKEGFPHFGYAILRVSGSNGDHSLLADYSPPSCNSMTVNCGPDYWLSAKTMGCAAEPSELEPDRCITSFQALQAVRSPNDDTSLCGDKKMAHEVAPNVQFTVRARFLPDEVPRWEGLSLNGNLEVCTEENWGFPYFTPADSAEWGAHQPIAFVEPSSPTLSLSADQREAIYSYRQIFREVDESNESENFPNYPVDFNRGVLGPNAVSVNYGDVIRVLFTCAEPYGPGCAMPHPMHLHGNKMAILYNGKWNEEYNISKFNPNPVYRDTITVNTDSYVVVQVAAINPGVWRWHCHVNIHHRGGMAMLLDVGGNAAAEAIRESPEDVNLCPIQLSEENTTKTSPTAGPKNSATSGLTSLMSTWNGLIGSFLFACIGWF